MAGRSTSLRQLGLELAVVGELGLQPARLLDEAGLAEYFARSCTPPGSRLGTACCARSTSSASEPDRALHIGDDEADEAAARGAGMQLRPRRRSPPRSRHSHEITDPLTLWTSFVLVFATLSYASASPRQARPRHALQVVDRRAGLSSSRSSPRSSTGSPASATAAAARAAPADVLVAGGRDRRRDRDRHVVLTAASRPAPEARQEQGADARRVGAEARGRLHRQRRSSSRSSRRSSRSSPSAASATRCSCRFGTWTAILLVGLLFGLAHGLVEAFPFLAAFGAGSPICAAGWTASTPE